MSTVSDLSDRIVSLRNQIREYQNCINDLQDSKTFLANKLVTFQDDVHDKLVEYDITQGEYWRGNRAIEAESHKETSTNNTAAIIDDVGDLINEIDIVIRHYEEKINNCRNEINNLESQLRSIVENNK